MYFLKSKITVLAPLVLLLIVGCGKLDEKKNIIGIWQIHSINVNGMEIGDGKGYIKFRDDGRDEVRTGVGLYEYGHWAIDTEKHEIVMSDDSSGAHYVYRMWDDSLLMTMNFPKQITALHCVKVSKEPVDPFSEGVAPDAFK
jgi:hypothetical protein